MRIRIRRQFVEVDVVITVAKEGLFYTASTNNHNHRLCSAPFTIRPTIDYSKIVSLHKQHSTIR